MTLSLPRVLPVLLLPLTLQAQTPKPSPTQDTKYLQTVRRTADTLLEKGRDTYGAEQSGMILSVLDRNGNPTPTLPRAPFGIRSSDRTGPGGSNANMQMDLYRVLEQLSRITGDPQYETAAHEALKDFLRITQSPNTGLLAWGEHLYWNCVEDRVGDINKPPIHEPKRKFIYFDYLYSVDPVRTLAYAKGLWDNQIFDKKTGDFSRHANWDIPKARAGFDFPKEGSYFIDTWSRAYAHTKDPLYANAVTVLANRYLGRSNERGLLDFDTSPLPERDNLCVTLWLISLALECHDAIPRMDAATAAILKKLEATEDKGFLSLPHDPSNPEKGFVCYAFTDSGEPRPREEKKSNGYSSHWGMGYGINTTGMFGTLCYSRQAQLGATKDGDAYRKLVVAAADLYRTLPVPLDDHDIWAGEFGLAIFTELGAYRLTKKPEYLAAAQKLADQAIDIFWDQDRPLPRASSKTDLYDVTSYPDTLILSLLAVHEATIGAEPKVDISDITR